MFSPDVDVGDVDRDDFVGRLRLEALAQDRLGNPLGVFQHGFVGARRADGLNDSLADAGDDGFFRRAADELPDVGADRHAGPRLEPNAVAGDGVQAFRPIASDRDSR